MIIIINLRSVILCNGSHSTALQIVLAYRIKIKLVVNPDS